MFDGVFWFFLKFYFQVTGFCSFADGATSPLTKFSNVKVLQILRPALPNSAHRISFSEIFTV